MRLDASTNTPKAPFVSVHHRPMRLPRAVVFSFAGALGCSHSERACVALPHGAAGATPAHHHRFDDAARWAAEFENPERDAWQRPDALIADLALPPDARVADLGAGTGYFAARLARAVPQGRVWGVDVEPSMVRWLNDRARREGLANLYSTLATPDDALLPEAVDLVLVVDTYHHIDDRTAYFGRLRASLRPGARLVVVDYRRDSPIGPPAAARVPPDEVRRDLESAGYTFDRAIESLPRQYVLIFRAAPDRAPGP